MSETEMFLSDAALALLDELWPLPSLTLSEVKWRMEQRFGMKFTNEQLRRAANRNKPSQQTARGPAIPITALRPAVKVWKPVMIRDTQCKARVPKGTYQVPLGGFSMFRNNKGG